MRTDSVISTSRRWGGRPVSASACFTTSTISRPFLNWRGERFTATFTSAGQLAASAQAARMPTAPMGTMSPVASAMG